MVNKINSLNIYKGKKILLTGHTGFKGSWLLKIFAIIGAEVKGYALEPENELNLFNIIKGEKLSDSVIADIRDKDKLKYEINNFQPDFIFHLAAQPLVRRSYDIPAETFEINAIGTANLLEAMVALNKPCIAVLITTDKVYHNNEWEYPYRENDRLGGYDPYSASKACAELIIDSYKNSFFNKKDFLRHKKSLAIGRAGNVIGGGDWAVDRLIPDIVRSLNSNTEIKVRNPNSIRPWQHVLESLNGYLQLGVKLSENPILYSTAYNFGPFINDTLPVSSILEMSLKYWGSGKFYNDNSIEHPHESGLLKLDINKAMIELGWKPRLTAEKAVEDTINWYKAYYENKQDMSYFTENQILNFFNG